MNFIAKQTIGTWITLGALILTLVGAILYGVNTSSGYYTDVVSGSLVACTVLAMIAMAALLVLSQFSFDGLIGKIVGIVVDLLKIVIPMLLFFALFGFVSTRIEGLAYIYGSNEEILATIQTPENLNSTYVAITGFVFYGIAAVGAVVAAFCRPVKAADAEKVKA